MPDLCLEVHGDEESVPLGDLGWRVEEFDSSTSRRDVDDPAVTKAPLRVVRYEVRAVPIGELTGDEPSELVDHQ